MECNHTNGLPLRIHDNKNGLDYTLHGTITCRSWKSRKHRR